MNAAQPPTKSTGSLITEIKAADQDYEFYPTTDEIIQALVHDIKYGKSVDLAIPREFGSSVNSFDGYCSVLDIGAGNGKVLMALKEGTALRELHAIEKSPILCKALDPEILIVGTDFAEQSLLSKSVDVIFCNPPYSQYEDWAEKIIRQAASHVVYLVIPQRWESSAKIADAIKFRNADCHKVGKFTFEDADRQARAVVHLLRIKMVRWNKDDAFDRFFAEQFGDLISKFKAPKAGDKKEGAESEKKSPFSELVVGENYPNALVGLYNQEMANIEKNYHLVAQLDVPLLKEFEISPDRIMACLKTRLTGLRNAYWNELFSHLSTVTDRLTSDSRKKLLDTLQTHVQVDFTVSNIYAVIIWVIKNANRYMDSQLLTTYDLMVQKANVVLYKSNQKTFMENRWRYSGDQENSHYALDYRIVTHRIGGIAAGGDFRDKGLEERAAVFLGDLLTIANNLGFRCETVHPCLDRNGREGWVSGKTQVFYFTDKNGNRAPLYDVKAFKNGNLHMRLHKTFILALNVEHGRLKGWLRNASEAVEELGDVEAADFFKTNLQLPMSNPGLLLNAANPK